MRALCSCACRKHNVKWCCRIDHRRAVRWINGGVANIFGLKYGFVLKQNGNLYSSLPKHLCKYGMRIKFLLFHFFWWINSLIFCIPPPLYFKDGPTAGQTSHWHRRQKCWRSNGELPGLSLHQPVGDFWPESQMALGAFGAPQSQRLRNLSALTPSLSRVRAAASRHQWASTSKHLLMLTWMFISCHCHHGQVYQVSQYNATRILNCHVFLTHYNWIIYTSEPELLRWWWEIQVWLLSRLFGLSHQGYLSLTQPFPEHHWFCSDI